jgi:formylglycine-generating enzyme required for sulfatase activity
MRYGLLLAAVFLSLLAVASCADGAVVVQWATVGDAGNAADPATFRGSVPYVYQMGKYDVTNAQYMEFLNAKDPTGANALGLYDSRMTTDLNVAGIAFDGGAASGPRYSAISGAENHPVAYVSWYSAVRFANWLNNGQGNADTESGSYTLLGGTRVPSNGISLTRNAGANVVLPTENEWYKAAYYKGGGASAGYWLYATQSDVRPASAPPGSGPNSANYLSDDGKYALTGSSIHDPSQNYLTDVGAYIGSPSAYGTFDQNGDLFQWLETAEPSLPSAFRLDRGGDWSTSGDFMESSISNSDADVASEAFLGFRVAQVPEPTGTLALLLLGVGVLTHRMRG